MSEIENYTVLSGSRYYTNLEQKVLALIKKGYVPIGGVSALTILEKGTTSQITFIQAMVKYKS